MVVHHYVLAFSFYHINADFSLKREYHVFIFIKNVERIMLVKERITSKIERLLSKVYYCRPERLREDSAIFSVNTDVRQVYIKIAAYRNCTVICTSEDLQEKTRKFLRGKSRDEIFELPLVYGQTIHYVPGNLFSGNLCESCVAERLFCFIRHLSQILVLKWQPVDVVTYPYG